MNDLLPKLPYVVFISLMMLGLYSVIVRRNFVRKLVGLTIFQTAVILFFLSLSPRWGGDVPIASGHGHVEAGHDEDGHDGHEGKGEHGHEKGVPIPLHNPLPHVLMLTAIVVGVSTTGVGLAICLRIHARYHSLEEDEILQRIEA